MPALWIISGDVTGGCLRRGALGVLELCPFILRALEAGAVSSYQADFLWLSVELQIRRKVFFAFGAENKRSWEGFACLPPRQDTPTQSLKTRNSP